MNPNHHNNEWFEELCAMAAIGELSSGEFEELNQHLAECGNCRELYADFRRISTDDIGLVAAGKRLGDEVSKDLDEQQLLKRFLQRAERERESTGSIDNLRNRDPLPHSSSAWIRKWLYRPALAYGCAVLAFSAVLGVSAYRLGKADLAPDLTHLHVQLNDLQIQAERAMAQQRATAQALQQHQFENRDLQNALQDAQIKYAELRERQKILQTQLKSANSTLEQQGRALQAASRSSNQWESTAEDLQAKLQEASLRADQQAAVVVNLDRKLRQAQREATVAGPQVEDAEAKLLFGARDLHIIDVHDVDSSGQTQRTYGRVYYVEKKLLLFYAFDLQDKRHNRMAAGFQAWGYHEADDGKPENLGLFYVDDASLNRWVLKVKNPRILERIDAVFVTLEPPNGSPSPRGRKLLYANLTGPPNHP